MVYLCLRAEEVRLGMRPARGDEVEVLAGGVLEQLRAADDVIVVNFDEPLLARLSPGRSQAAEGYVRPPQLKRMVFLMPD